MKLKNKIMNNKIMNNNKLIKKQKIKIKIPLYHKKINN